MNKKQIYNITIIFSALILSILLPVSVFAASNSKAGVMPGSFWYGFDTAFENINLFFTFNSEKKAKKAMEYADERLAEIEEIEKSTDEAKSKSEDIAEAVDNYKENVALAVTKARETKDEVKTETLLSTIASSTSKHQEILTAVLEKVPAEAKDAIQKAIEAGKKEREEITKRISELKKENVELKNRTEELKKDVEKQEIKGDKVEIKSEIKDRVEVLGEKQKEDASAKEVRDENIKNLFPKTITSPTTSAVSAPFFRMVSPNGGETLEIGKTYDIKWEGFRLNSTSNVVINLLSSASIKRKVIAVAPNTGIYKWTIPESMSSELEEMTGLSAEAVYMIFIEIDNGEQDFSDNKFRLIEKYEPTADSFVSSDSWFFVFTHRGTLLASEAVDFLCGTVRRNIISWMEQQAVKYNQSKPFKDIICLQGQTYLEGDLLVGDTIPGEQGVPVTVPVNKQKTRDFMERKYPILSQAKYVTVFHYIPRDIPMVNFTDSPAYDFNFIITPFVTMPFVPELRLNNYAETLIHELMHKMGASDKYGSTYKQACLTNPSTGQEYSGYDVMCHRIPPEPPFNLGGGGFGSPQFSKLVVSEPTAVEIGWLKK